MNARKMLGSIPRAAPQGQKYYFTDPQAVEFAIYNSRERGAGLAATFFVGARVPYTPSQKRGKVWVCVCVCVCLPLASPPVLASLRCKLLAARGNVHEASEGGEPQQLHNLPSCMTDFSMLVLGFGQLGVSRNSGVDQLWRHNSNF